MNIAINRYSRIWPFKCEAMCMRPWWLKIFYTWRRIWRNVSDVLSRHVFCSIRNHKICSFGTAAGKYCQVSALHILSFLFETGRSFQQTETSHSWKFGLAHSEFLALVQKTKQYTFVWRGSCSCTAILKTVLESTQRNAMAFVSGQNNAFITVTRHEMSLNHVPQEFGSISSWPCGVYLQYSQKSS